MIIKLYENNPNQRDINKIADIIGNGGIAVIPTDTLYSLVCSIDFKNSVETIARLKGFSLKKARYSLLFDSMSRVSEYVRPMSRDLFSVLKQCLPGPFTFVMDANNNVPRNYQNPNKTIGIRMPDNGICRAIIETVGRPLIGTSVRTVNGEYETEYITDPELIDELFGKHVDVVVDGGIGGVEPSTVVDCSNDQMELIRQGRGILPFEL